MSATNDSTFPILTSSGSSKSRCFLFLSSASSAEDHADQRVFVCSKRENEAHLRRRR